MSVELLSPLESEDRRPRVSVVMPTYRRADALCEAVRAILEQTERDIELVIMDDCSPDDTGDVVATIKDQRIHYFRNPINLRIPGNINEGIRHSRGKYVMICHDHDVYRPTLLQKLSELLDRHTNALFAHAGCSIVDSNGSETGVRFVRGHPEVSGGSEWLETMLSEFASPVCGLSMIRRDAYERFGLFDPTYGWTADVELWMRLSMHGDVGYVKEALIGLRGREPGDRFWGVNWTLVDEVIRIHRDVRQRTAAAGLRCDSDLAFRLRKDRHLLNSYLASLVRHDAEHAREGQAVVNRHGSVALRAAIGLSGRLPFLLVSSPLRFANKVRRAVRGRATP